MALCEEALVGCFGTAIRRHIAGRASSAWTTDPFIGGAYSCAKPGYARVRKLLQETVHGAIQFAGEHTSSDGMATAHGAFLSGHAAVVRALALPGGASDPLWLPEGA
jgi:monoamine oxidase